MALEINYGELGDSESIKANVERNVERVLRVVRNPDEITARLWIDVENNQLEAERKLFKVAMQIYWFGEKRVFVEKQGEDFFSCLKNALDVARVLLVKNH